MSVFRTTATNSLTSWIAPDPKEPEEKICAYVTTLISDYTRSLQSSANYKNLHRAIEALTKFEPTVDDRKIGRLSSLSFNRTKVQAKKLIAILSNIKPVGEFESCDPELAEQSSVLSSLYRAIWLHPNTRMRKTLIDLFQYAITGEGYLYTSWESDPFRNREPSLSFRALSIDDVAFAQLPKDKDIQKAYTTVIRHELPIATACMLYPDHMAYFTPSAQAPTWLKKLKTATTRLFQSEALNVSYDEAMQAGSFPHSQSPLTSESTIDIYECYIMDFSVNKSGKVMEMGTPGTPEYYRVPYVGQEIDTCLVDPMTGQPVRRKANTKDCLIYPNRRRIICTSNHVISDGPSPWAHGQTPLTRFTLNDWVWDRVGDPVALEGERLNWTIEALYKGFHDMVERQVRPGLRLPNTLASSTVEAYDSRKPNAHLRVDPFTNQSIEPVVPYQLNTLQSTALEFSNLLKQECDYMIGEPDVRALAQAQQVPSAETFEKFLQLSGPLTTFVALNIESSLMEVGEQVKALLMQFCTAPRRYHILGDRGLTREDFDYDPGNMIPANKFSSYGDSIFPTTLNERARLHSRRFTYRIIAGAAYQLTDIQHQMMTLQLWRDPKNFPIGPFTVASMFGINLGVVPEEAGKTEIEQWEWWQRKQSQLGIQLQAQGQITMAQVQMAIQQAMQTQQANQIMTGLGAMMGGGEVEGGEIDSLATTDLDKRSPGRPPSGAEPPHMVNKGDRTVIAES